MTKPKKKTYAKLNPAHLRQLREHIEQHGFPAVAKGTGLRPNTLYAVIRKARTSGVRPSTLQAILAYLAGTPAAERPAPVPSVRARVVQLDTSMEAFAKVYAVMLPLDEVTQQTVLKAVAKALGWD